ncbi:hypothetical protein EOM71_03710 [Candidatus Falkowbacteria bacterium]|nr:hypothetical protein [Candidatus Falkowbacteria bacterium]
METSKNLAAQIVDNACQEFQQFVDQQAVLAPMAEKNSRVLKIWIKIGIFALALLFLSIIAWLLLSVFWVDKKTFMLSMNIALTIMALNLIPALIMLYFFGKVRLHQQISKKIAAGRLNYIKEIINQALMAHMCANEDDKIEDFYFKRMKKITSGFFADDFNPSLTEEETAELRSWLKASYSACIRAD